MVHLASERDSTGAAATPTATKAADRQAAHAESAHDQHQQRRHRPGAQQEDEGRAHQDFPKVHVEQLHEDAERDQVGHAPPDVSSRRPMEDHAHEVPDRARRDRAGRNLQDARPDRPESQVEELDAQQHRRNRQDQAEQGHESDREDRDARTAHAVAEDDGDIGDDGAADDQGAGDVEVSERVEKDVAAALLIGAMALGGHLGIAEHCPTAAAARGCQRRNRRATPATATGGFGLDLFPGLELGSAGEADGCAAVDVHAA